MANEVVKGRTFTQQRADEAQAQRNKNLPSSRLSQTDQHPQEQPATLSQEAGESAYKALEYQKWQRERHKHPERFPIPLPQRKLLAKCEYGNQVFTFHEGTVPICPDCGGIMVTLAEVKK